MTGLYDRNSFLNFFLAGIPKFLRPFKRCYICGKGNRDTSERLCEASWNDDYGGCVWVYHETCFKRVLGNPEENEEILDWTLRLEEYLSELKSKKEERMEQIKKRLIEAQKRQNHTNT